jgi:peptidoglycan glycosyltransferase
VTSSLTSTLRKLSVVVAVLFLALLVNVNIVQVARQDSLANGVGNNRSLIREYARQRGPILVGVSPIATSTLVNGLLRYQRSYTNGALYAPATGFYSLIYGRTGIERAENDVLSGSDPRFALQRLSDLVAGRAVKGGSVLLTLNAKAQAAAMAQMAGKVGAVVAIQPSTGAILALVSNPSFDPTPLASTDTAVERKAWATLIADPAKPMLNRPLAELYPPGSTFKIVTLSAALSSGKYNLDTLIPSPATITLPGTHTKLSNENGQQCGNGMVTLAYALAVSCNTAFANVGIALGGDALQKQAELYGFNSSFQVPMTAATSTFPTNLVKAQAAQSAIGQFDVRSTALQMAMVAAGVANGGVVNRPYLVSQALGPDLSVLDSAQVTPFNQAVTAQVAQMVTDMMVGVVENGTGTNAQIPGVKVAGKTGTAQTGGGRPPDAWFVSFAPADGAQVAVAVVVEGAKNDGEISGGRLAAPVAKAVMEAVLGG